MKSIKILDVKVNNVTMNETVRLIESFIVSRKPHQIVTVNPEMIMNSQLNTEVKNIINNADLVIPDGAGLLFASKLIGQKLSQRVTGTDLVDNLAKLASQKKYSIFFLGAEPGVAKLTSQILIKKYPNLVVAGYSDASPNFSVDHQPKYKFPYNNRITDLKSGLTDHNSKIAHEIRLAKPDILLVAYGHPKQELFISRYKNVLNTPVMMGVGGAFDFISGRTKRAPKILQILWLEWLWRLLTEPKRFKRIFTAVIVFPWCVFVDKVTQKK